MPTSETLIANVITLLPNLSVGAALELLKQNNIRTAPVVDEKGVFHGMFGVHSLMEDLLPAAARIEDGIADLGFVVGAAPGAAKRIRKILPDPVSAHMDDEFFRLSPDTPVLEIIRMLARHGSPLPVVTPNDNRFVGLVSEQSCLAHLYDVLETVEEEEKTLSGQ